MKSIIDRTNLLLKHLSILDDVLKSDNEYASTSEDLDRTITNDMLDSIYYGVNDERNGRQMCLADIIEYTLFGRAYWDIIRRNREHTKLNSFKNYYKLLIKITNLLFLQDSILSQKGSFNLRRRLLKELKVLIDDDSKTYDKLNKYSDFLHGEWGSCRKSQDETLRKSAYKQLDQILPKVRGLPNEIIAYIHLLRKNCGIILPLFLNQRFISFDTSLENGRVDFLAPPDIFVLNSNKNIIGIEVGRGSDRQVNKFSSSTGIPVVFADTEKISNHRCPFCMKWTLFCDFVIEHGVDPYYRDVDEMNCKDCNVPNKNQGRNCRESLVYMKIPEFYSGYAHYHLHCVENYLRGLGYNQQKIDDFFNNEEIFTYFPHVDGLKNLTNLYFQLP